MSVGFIPAGVPAEALLVGVIVFVIAIYRMNRGNKWVINLLAQDEPLLVAVGAVMLLIAKTPFGVTTAGVLIAHVFIARYTDLVDIT